MTDLPANPNITPSRYPAFWFRLLEIFPGACVWTAIILPFILSVNYPLAVTIFIIVFDSYWLVMALNYAYILLRGYSRLRGNLQRDWQAQLDATLALPAEEQAARGFIDWRELYHAIILATYQEPQSTLEASIDSIIKADYPKDHLLIVLATEGRDATNVRLIAKALTSKYKDACLRFIVTEHPDNLPGEVKAKGANVTWAAKQLVEEVQALGIPFNKVIVSTADADTRFHPHYFQALSFHYATNPERIHSAYQPVSTFFNNIWDAPIFSRLMAFGTTFWQMVEGVRNYRLITFSTHAMSLETLVDIRYWCTSIVNEDSRQFFRAYFHYNGNFQVIPLFMPIYMDAVHSGSFLETFKSLYKQQRRWAYGVEHFPYIVLESFHRRKIPLMNRIMLIYRAFQGSFSWATASFFLSVVGWIPIILNPTFRSEVAVANFIIVTRNLISFTWIGLILSSILSVKILPPAVRKSSKHNVLIMALQWIFVPVTAIFFGWLPGLESLTRLMFGRYLGFRVTPKVQGKKPQEPIIRPSSAPS